MALLTKKDVAEKCCKPTNWLSVYIKRGKLVELKKGANKGMIDTSDPTNASFLEMYSVNVEAFSAPKAVNKRKTQAEPSNDDDFDDEPVSSGDDDGEQYVTVGGRKILKKHVSDQLYKHFQAEKTEKEAELNALKIQKLKGIVIPSAFISPLFLQHNQYIVQEQKNADDEMISMLSHRYDISAADVAYVRGEWVKRRNAAVQKATDMSVKGVENIVNEFSESRGRGERS